MTNPIQSPNVQIHPQFTPYQGTPGVELLLQALQHRQEIGLRKKQLQREQEQFELNKKLAGPQMEGMLLENDKKKRDLKNQEDDLAASDQALQLYTGNLSRLHDDQGIGEVLAGIKDPKVATHFYRYLKAGIDISNAQAPTYDLKTSPGATGDEYVAINSRDPTKNVRTGVRAPDASDSATRRIPVVTEREKASAALGAIRANAIISRVEAVDPTIGQRVARKVAVRKSLVSGIMRRVAGTTQEDANFAAEQQIEASMAPDELEYYVAAKGWLGAVLPGLSGKQVTGREYMMQAPAYFSMGSGNPGVTANRAAARVARSRSFAKEAGDAMNERQAEIAELAGLGIDLSQYGLGPKPAARPDPSRYFRP